MSDTPELPPEEELPEVPEEKKEPFASDCETCISTRVFASAAARATRSASCPWGTPPGRPSSRDSLSKLCALSSTRATSRMRTTEPSEFVRKTIAPNCAGVDKRPCVCTCNNLRWNPAGFHNRTLVSNPMDCDKPTLA